MTTSRRPSPRGLKQLESGGFTRLSVRLNRPPSSTRSSSPGRIRPTPCGHIAHRVVAAGARDRPPWPKAINAPTMKLQKSEGAGHRYWRNYFAGQLGYCDPIWLAKCKMKSSCDCSSLPAPAGSHDHNSSILLGLSRTDRLPSVLSHLIAFEKAGEDSLVTEES